MHELLFRPARFCGRQFELDDELTSSDRMALARSVVTALVATGIVDPTRLTNTAFHLQHPDRDLTKPIDPAREPHLAAEWKILKATIVTPALLGTPSAVPNAAQRNVLLVGDSHTHGDFGKELEALLEGSGATVERHAKIGSAVKYWLPLVPPLLRTQRPDTVIVALGANMRGYPSAAGTSAQIRQMVDVIRKEVPAARVIWIGPPRERADTPDKLERFNAIIRAGLPANVTFLDSAPHTPTYRGSDGVHYAAAAAKEWARGIYSELR